MYMCNGCVIAQLVCSVALRRGYDLHREMDRKSNSSKNIQDEVVLGYVDASRGKMQMKSIKGCGFCTKNREPSSFSDRHNLKDENGRVTCPILRQYKCQICGATGDAAHTMSHCPYKGNYQSVPKHPAERSANGLKPKK